MITTDGGFSPTTLPKQRFAPIKLHGYGKIATEDGTLPPVLERSSSGSTSTAQWRPRDCRCARPRNLAATTTAQARKLCPGAIVGKGFGKAVVTFPEQRPIPASSPITLFNGPQKHGNPTVLAHAHLTVPGPTTFVVPIEIEKVNDGSLRLQDRGEIPKIAGGAGIPIYGRTRSAANGPTRARS